MKRIIIMALVGVMAFSAVALGGWKTGAEQEVDVGCASYPLDVYVGWDFDAPFINTGPFSIAGDFVATRTYNWGASVLSGLIGFDAELVFGYVDDFDVIVTTSADIDYAPLPDSIELLAWDGGVEVVGYVNDVLTLNAGTKLLYGDIDPTWVFVYGFNTKFFFGFDAAW